jgi:hypothetical protein
MVSPSRARSNASYPFARPQNGHEDAIAAWRWLRVGGVRKQSDSQGRFPLTACDFRRSFTKILHVPSFRRGLAQREPKGRSDVSEWSACQPGVQSTVFWLDISSHLGKSVWWLSRPHVYKFKRIPRAGCVSIQRVSPIIRSARRFIARPNRAALSWARNGCGVAGFGLKRGSPKAVPRPIVRSLPDPTF